MSGASTRLFSVLFSLIFALLIITTTAQQQQQQQQRRAVWSSSTSARTTTASFVPPAAPRIIKSSVSSPSRTPTATLALIASGYGTFNNKKNNNNNNIRPASSRIVVPPIAKTSTSTTMTTALFAKKKKGAGKATKKKAQVKLLKHVAGTGQAGDVVMVTPSFFQNVLKRSQSAILITDEEVQKLKQETKAENEAFIKESNLLKDEITDYELNIKRKAGPEGQLFGGVSPKCIMDELKKKITSAGSQNYFKKHSKGIKITNVKDDNGETLTHDIKHTGSFDVSMSITKDIDATFTVNVITE